MDLTRLPRSFGATLPDWVLEELAHSPTVLPTHADRMELALRLAARNPLEGSGGPFAALVVDTATGELVVNWRPCAQCYGAVLWSGVKRLVIAGEGPEVEHLTGFDEGPMREDWAEQLRRRGVEVVIGVRREQAVSMFAEYGRVAVERGLTVYNARGGA
ncbi:nucleoside deaminase [Nocardia farcinica]|uniref:nucleoside deaminase n=1 Tax=Nocardia farcinica TaxID=37329 RepID=UPI00245393B4|nr:nucleoside deaminase [Nocardia farcinica]